MFLNTIDKIINFCYAYNDTKSQKQILINSKACLKTELNFWAA